MEKVEWPYHLTPLSWGAESNLYLSTYMGLRAVVKHRFKKPYMAEELAYRLIRERTLTEARALLTASEAGVRVPMPLYIEADRGLLVIEFIEGRLLRDMILELDKVKLIEIARALGTYVALLHNHDIIHGDLTTSNIILGGSGLFIIDFGLAYFSHRPIDKASDIRVLERALVSSHPGVFDDFISSFFRSYISDVKEGSEIQREFLRLSTMGRYYKRRYIF